MSKNQYRGYDVSTFLTVLRDRMPKGYILDDLLWSAVDYRYGLKVTATRFVYHLAVFCLGGSHIHPNRPLAELKPPYPTLYHFTQEANIESIKAKGLLPNRGRVWMTDWTNKRWAARFGDSICFRIDTDQLISSGHKIYILERCHEFITDYVPPECLSIMK